MPSMRYAPRAMSPKSSAATAGGLLPAALNRSEGRRLARRATGKSWIPLLLTNDGELIAGSTNIKEWAIHQLAQSSTSASGNGPTEQ